LHSFLKRRFIKGAALSFFAVLPLFKLKSVEAVKEAVKKTKKYGAPPCPLA